MIQIYSTFEHSNYLELAINELEKGLVAKENIFAVPLTNQKVERRIFDSIHNSDGISLMSTGAALALSVVGASVGFRLKWGPIYWGLIGAVGGFLLGFLIDLFINKVIKKRQRLLRGKNSEVILIVECEEKLADPVESILASLGFRNSKNSKLKRFRYILMAELQIQIPKRSAAVPTFPILNA